mmetsp:Transcript_25593/g.12120  ORF Transcript_25593/g.12120 Transcript_25593/m.12120 type:complete len:121 (+) Transcript_25593:353-715(+)
MLRRSKVINFLTIYSDWDPSLMFVMVGALGVNFITFPLLKYKTEQPVFKTSYGAASYTKVDTKLIIGAVLFGVGWGLAGMCPGPGMCDVFIFFPTLFFFLGLVVGMMGFDLVMSWMKKEE